MKAVVLCGGLGTRLRPLTYQIPKPLLPVGKEPILTFVIKQLVNHGFKDICLATGYKSELIEAHYADGKAYDANITYSKETEPLGTAGPLKKINDLDKTFLVINGDILTNLDLKKLYKFHKENNAIATIAAKERNVKIDFGVITEKEHRLSSYEEKPRIDYLVSMGINILEPEAIEHIPSGRFDLPELMLKLKSTKRVYTYRTNCRWYDVGRMEDYNNICNNDAADLVGPIE